MSHHIYTTEGFIIESRESGEANRSLLIFTKDFGMIYTFIQGVRKITSKLRFHIEELSYKSFSLVKGRDKWRITGISDVSDNSSAKNKIIKSDRTVLAAYANILNLLKRLLSGAEKNEQLFDIVYSFYEYATSHLEVEQKGKIKNVEALTVLRILNCLGYVKKLDFWPDFAATHSIDDVSLDKVDKNYNEVIKEINTALRESHL